MLTKHPLTVKCIIDFYLYYKRAFSDHFWFFKIEYICFLNKMVAPGKIST